MLKISLPISSNLNCLARLREDTEVMKDRHEYQNTNKDSLFILDSFHFDFLGCKIELIHVRDDCRGLNVHQDE